MKRLFLPLCLLVFLAPVGSFADDLTFDSFSAAEAAAQKRAQDYQQKMDEHMKDINNKWEQQQKDLGADSSSPDISKITSQSDGQKSSDTDASKSMENAVNSSVNKLKDSMMSSAGPNSTGFAGGGAGYQWSVKFQGGKYVLSDSYNEAAFNTGDKKPKSTPKPATPAQPSASGQNSDNKAVANKSATTPTEKDQNTTPENQTNPASDKTQVANLPSGTTPTAATTEKPQGKGTPPQKTTGSTVAQPATPGFDPAPPNLPPPAIKLVIQHPTDFTEEVFSSNADSESPTNYQLDKFKIPEDTRIKIALELSKDIKPEDVSVVITDEEGERAPVSSAKMKNYRHMFRVPSDDKYSASVFINDKSKPGNYQKKLMQVRIPVTKVDFESRTIDNQRGGKPGENSNSASLSANSTSSSGSAGNFSHSTSHSQQVDLSDLYSDGSPVSEQSSTGQGSFGQTGQSGGAADSSGSSGSGYASTTGTGGSQNESADSSANTAANTGNPSSSGSDSGRQGGFANNSSSGNSGSSSSGDYENSSNNSGDNTTAEGNNEGTLESEDEDNASDGSSSSSGSSTDAGDSGQRNRNADYDDDSAASTGTINNTTGAYDESDESIAFSNDQGNYQVASARDMNTQASPGKDNSNGAGAIPANSQNPVLTQEDDPFIMALSIKSEKQKIFQSFDFIDQGTQMSAAIPAGTEITFSINMSKKVDPKSLRIKISDGTQEFSGDLKNMGESFAYVFPKPSGNSFIQIVGKVANRPFNYRLSMPVIK